MVRRILAITPSDDEEVIVFALTFAAHRYMLSQNRDAYERLVRRYGEPDHPMVRHARAFVYDNDIELVEHSPHAATRLRQQGEHHLADLMEMGCAGSLLALGRFEELDTLAATLVDRFEDHGPPTLLNWILFMLGYSASCQGIHDIAEQFFDESAAVDVPTGTIPVNAPFEARAALRRGNPSGAIRILRSHVEELLESDAPAVARLACVVFIDMMASFDRLAEAAPMLAYLGTAGEFGALSATTLVADAARKIAANSELTPDQHQKAAEPLDDAQALEYMRDVLDQLADNQQITD